MPLAAIALAPTAHRTMATGLVSIVALGLLGAASASLGGAPLRPAVVRVVLGGLAAMALTVAIGTLLGSAGG